MRLPWPSPAFPAAFQNTQAGLSRLVQVCLSTAQFRTPREALNTQVRSSPPSAATHPPLASDNISTTSVRPPPSSLPFFLAHRSEPTSRVRRPQANATISAPRLFTSPEESWLRHRIGPQRWLSSRLPPSSSCLSATVVPARYVEIAFLRASLCLYRPPAELLPRLRRPAQRSSRPRTSRSHANRRPLPV